MTQREVFPQAQSLCFAVQARQAQYSHQIHLRWFTSRMKRATIQSRISVFDTPSNVSAYRACEQWAERPSLGRRGSYEAIDTGRSDPRSGRSVPSLRATSAWRRRRGRLQRG